MDFKVGDYVRVLKSSNSGLPSAYIVGNIYRIATIHNQRIATIHNQRIDTISIEGYYNSWGDHNFVRVTLTRLEKVLYSISD